MKDNKKLKLKTKIYLKLHKYMFIKVHALLVDLMSDSRSNYLKVEKIFGDFKSK